VADTLLTDDDAEIIGVDDGLESADTPLAYSSETTTVRRRSASGSGNATGRRKEAVARVRLVPGTGQWKVNGRTIENYFPNKVHQQLVKSPLKMPSTASSSSTSSPASPAAASAARPVRCASASPVRSSRSTPRTGRP
jgi:hypothetical protein